MAATESENGPTGFPVGPLSSKPPTYPCELVGASRPRSIPLPWRVASFPEGPIRVQLSQRPHNRERVHNPVEPGENYSSDALSRWITLKHKCAGWSSDSGVKVLGIGIESTGA